MSTEPNAFLAILDPCGADGVALALELARRKRAREGLEPTAACRCARHIHIGGNACRYRCPACLGFSLVAEDLEARGRLLS
jgi:hypothetical protein